MRLFYFCDSRFREVQVSCLSPYCSCSGPVESAWIHALEKRLKRKKSSAASVDETRKNVALIMRMFHKAAYDHGVDVPAEELVKSRPSLVSFFLEVQSMCRDRDDSSQLKIGSLTIIYEREC